MADCEEQQALRYSAFISYSHRDAATARRLHRALENYRLPRRVAARQGAEKGQARRLRPIFRDREDLPAAPDLTQAVRRAIAEASYLIVICSQHASTSAWVARELSLFREVHGEGAVLAALVDGADDETLSSIFRAEARGSREPEPLAADFRKEGDGDRLALLKLVAVLADVRLDDLVQRDAQRRVRQVTMFGAAAMLGMAVMSALALAAVKERNAADRERIRGEALIDYLLSDLRGHLKSVGRLDVLSLVNQGALNYYTGQHLEELPPAALLQRAKLLQAIGEDDETRGNLKSARAQFDEAKRTTATLLKAAPGDPDRLFAHAQSEYYLGAADWTLGDDAGAESGFTAYAQLAQRLADIAPSRPEWLMEKGYSESNLGMFVLRRSMDTRRAGLLFTEAFATFEQVASARPKDRDVQVQLADGYAWLADVERLRGNYAGAIASRESQRRIIDSLLVEDPRDFEVRSDLVSNRLGVARIAAARGQFANALLLFQKDHDDALDLAREDPENADISDQARALELFEVRTWLSMPVSERPAIDVLAQHLGNCAADKMRANGAELMSFCLSISAHLLAASGDMVDAKNQQSQAWSLRQSGDRLTRRWLLNLQEEAKFQ